MLAPGDWPLGGHCPNAPLGTATEPSRLWGGGGDDTGQLANTYGMWQETMSPQNIKTEQNEQI